MRSELTDETGQIRGSELRFPIDVLNNDAWHGKGLAGLVARFIDLASGFEVEVDPYRFGPTRGISERYLFALRPGRAGS